MRPVEVIRGDGPIVFGMPHTGTWLPAAVRDRLNGIGRLLSDTDWWIDRLYEGLLPGVTVVRSMFHRYVIDANRDPSGVSLYPGENTTGLVPLTDFDGKQIWTTPPDKAEVARRRDAFHRPYHAALTAEMERIRSRYGVAVLYDCHSIRSVIPFLFAGCLPDFSIGTNGATTCAAEIQDAAVDVCADAEGYSVVLNGRFKGGWTTRHYGRPAEGWHAIQVELAQSTYLSEGVSPYLYDTEKAERLRRHLRDLLNRIETIAYSLGGRN